MQSKGPEVPTVKNNAQHWTSTLIGIAEVLTIIPADRPVTYENVVEQEMTQKSLTAGELNRRGLMDLKTWYTVVITSQEILQINQSALPQNRRRTIVHKLIEAQDQTVIDPYKYA